MQFNPSRYQLLDYLYAGLKKTGHSLIEYDGHSISPIFTINNSVDDIGLFILVPRLAHFFNLTINRALDIFFYGLWVIAVILGLIGIICLYRKSLNYCVAACFAFFTCCILNLFYVREVYFMYSFNILALLPLAIFFFREKTNSVLFYSFFIIAGTIFGLSHIVRSYSSFGIALWLVFSILLMSHERVNKKTKLITSFIFMVSFSLPIFYAKKIEQHAEQYLISNREDYCATPHIHPHWHSFYLGFGFLEFLNPTGIIWADGWAFQEARKIIPGIDQNDVRYDPLIKRFAINFIINHPVFILITLWSKIGILLYYLIRYLHLSLMFIFKKLTRKEGIPIFAGIAVYSLFPLLAVPANAYTLGLVVFTYIHALVLFTDRLITENYSKLKTIMIFGSFLIFSLINSGMKFLIAYFQ